MEIWLICFTVSSHFRRRLFKILLLWGHNNNNPSLWASLDTLLNSCALKTLLYRKWRRLKTLLTAIWEIHVFIHQNITHFELIIGAIYEKVFLQLFHDRKKQYKATAPFSDYLYGVECTSTPIRRVFLNYSWLLYTIFHFS